LNFGVGGIPVRQLSSIIWKGVSIKSFLLFTETVSARLDAFSAISKLLTSGQIMPIVAKTFALEDAAEAIRYLVEDHPSVGPS